MTLTVVELEVAAPSRVTVGVSHGGPGAFPLHYTRSAVGCCCLRLAKRHLRRATKLVTTGRVGRDGHVESGARYGVANGVTNVGRVGQLAQRPVGSWAGCPRQAATCRFSLVTSTAAKAREHTSRIATSQRTPGWEAQSSARTGQWSDVAGRTLRDCATSTVTLPLSFVFGLHGSKDPS